MNPQMTARPDAHSRVHSTHGALSTRIIMRMVLPLAFAAALLAAPEARAAQSVVSGPAANRASAAIDFRIIVPESVRFMRGQEQRDRTRQYTSRTVEVIDGQRTMTIARP